MEYSPEQRRVLAGMASGMAVAAGGLFGALIAGDTGLVTGPGAYSRLDFWAGWAVPPVLMLILAVGTMARQRFVEPADIAGAGLSEASRKARIGQAILQNTLEQLVLWLVVSLVWALRMPVWTMGVLPVSAILFTLGRMLFARRYAEGAGARALGFALTFYPTVAMALLLVIELIGLLPR